ncbi:MAG: ribbon-helix-helix domain-containing protein [Promethearchaeota archaeon]
MEKKSEDKKMKMITLFLPESYIEILDLLVARGLYPNRSEALRMAAWRFMEEGIRMLQFKMLKNLLERVENKGLKFKMDVEELNEAAKFTINPDVFNLTKGLNDSSILDQDRKLVALLKGLSES